VFSYEDAPIQGVVMIFTLFLVSDFGRLDLVGVEEV
jgi:hypothetical protein